MMKKYTEYYSKNYDHWLVHEPWKIYFSLGRTFGRHEWVEWAIALGQGFFYLGAGLLMFLWLAVRVLFYPITRATVVYKCHKRAKKRAEKKMKKSVDIFNEL